MICWESIERILLVSLKEILSIYAQYCINTESYMMIVDGQGQRKRKMRVKVKIKYQLESSNTD